MPKVPDKSAKADPSDAGAPAAESAAAPQTLEKAVARARWLMLISALTTVVAVAAVTGVVGYRLFHAGGSGPAAIVNGTIFLPAGAHIDSTTVDDGRIVVTLDIAGATEVRIFDLKTLQQTGQLHFAPRR